MPSAKAQQAGRGTFKRKTGTQAAAGGVEESSQNCSQQEITQKGEQGEVVRGSESRCAQSQRVQERDSDGKTPEGGTRKDAGKRAKQQGSAWEGAQKRPQHHGAAKAVQHPEPDGHTRQRCDEPHQSGAGEDRKAPPEGAAA